MPTSSPQELWERLRTFDFDLGPSAFTFRDRLARENGWTRARADRVIGEYRRFLLLAAAAGHPVSPSEDVDAAWHLHLTYTRSYWDDLCGRILPAPLHHGPTRGGAAERAKFDDWYARTLASYTRMFGEAPPADVWPDAAARAAARPRYARVDVGAAWIVPKPAWWPPRRSAVVAALIAASATTSACAFGEVLPLGAAGLVAIAVIGGIAMRSSFQTRHQDPRKRDQSANDGSSSSGCGSSHSSSSSRDCADGSGSGGDGCSDGGGGDSGGGDSGGGGGCGGGGGD